MFVSTGNLELDRNVFYTTKDFIRMWEILKIKKYIIKSNKHTSYLYVKSLS
jgi:hypothetical protein